MRERPTCMRQLRSQLHDILHAFDVMVYWPPRAVLRQFNRHPYRR